MNKIDYGDINKFLVSIGIVLIGLAVLTPYLYLKEDFGLYLEQESFEKLQEPIKNLITDKQEKITQIQKYIPCISITLFVLGLLSIIVGLVRWFKRQSKLDEKFDKEIKKLDLEIESLTPEEKERKALKEVTEIEQEEKKQEALLTEKIQPKNEAIQNYLKVENDIFKLFQNYKSPNFDVLPQQRIGNRFEIDLLLKAKTKKFSDRIIEIKYFKNQLPLSILNKSIYQLNTYISYYKEAANKSVVPVLFIVYNDKTISAEKIIDYKKRIFEYAKDIPNLERLKVEFIEESNIENFDIQTILKK